MVVYPISIVHSGTVSRNIYFLEDNLYLTKEVASTAFGSKIEINTFINTRNKPSALSFIKCFGERTNVWTNRIYLMTKSLQTVTYILTWFSKNLWRQASYYTVSVQCYTRFNMSGVFLLHGISFLGLTSVFRSSALTVLPASTYTTATNNGNKFNVWNPTLFFKQSPDEKATS